MADRADGIPYDTGFGLKFNPFHHMDSFPARPAEDANMPDYAQVWRRPP